MTIEDGSKTVQAVANRDEPVLDIGDLQQRCMGNAQLVERVLLQLEPAVDDECRKLAAAVSAQDAAAIAAAAHRLKGTAANVGAARLQQAADGIESLARKDASIEDLTVAHRQLCAERSRLIEVLHRQVAAYQPESSGS